MDMADEPQRLEALHFLKSLLLFFRPTTNGSREPLVRAYLLLSGHCTPKNMSKAILTCDQVPQMGNIFICLKMGSIFLAPPNDDVDPTIHGQ